jgi:hypothetical protein
VLSSIRFDFVSHYRGMAQEARKQAQASSDPDTRDLWLKFARDYEERANAEHARASQLAHA